MTSKVRKKWKEWIKYHPVVLKVTKKWQGGFWAPGNNVMLFTEVLKTSRGPDITEKANRSGFTSTATPPARSVPFKMQSACHTLYMEHPECWAAYESSIKAISFFSLDLPISGCLFLCMCPFSAATDLSRLLFQRANTVCIKAVCCAKVLNLGWRCIFDQDLCKFQPPTEWIFSFALKTQFTSVCICVSTSGKAFI